VHIQHTANIQLSKPPVEASILFTYLSPQTDKSISVLLKIKLFTPVFNLTLLSWSQMPVLVLLEHSNCQPSGPSWPYGSPACTCACTPCGKLGLSYRWVFFVPYGTESNWK